MQIWSLCIAMLIAMLTCSSASAAQLSAEDQYVDTGPTGNGVDLTPAPGNEDETGFVPGSPVLGPVENPATPSGSGNAGDGGVGRGADQVTSKDGAGKAEGGSLPIFGYPLTPLVGLVLGMLAVAVAVRIVTKLSETRLGQRA